MINLSRIRNKWLELILRLGDGGAHRAHHDASVARCELLRRGLDPSKRSGCITVLHAYKCSKYTPCHYIGVNIYSQITAGSSVRLHTTPATAHRQSGASISTRKVMIIKKSDHRRKHCFKLEYSRRPQEFVRQDQ